VNDWTRVTIFVDSNQAKERSCDDSNHVILTNDPTHVTSQSHFHKISIRLIVK